MRHNVKGFVAAAAVLGGFVARELTTGYPLVVRYVVYAAAVAIVFVHNIWDLKPDTRIEKIRDTDLDAALKTAFAGPLAGLGASQRQPLRANLVRRGRTWYGRPVLKQTYTLWWLEDYDADFGMAWPKGHGLCWHVYRTGIVDFTRTGEAATEKYRLSEDEARKTEKVSAVLCLPVRSAHAKPGRWKNRKVDAVLNIDAVTDQAADKLEELYGQVLTDPEHPLRKVAGYAGLFC